jgi:hypothetical protein
MQAPIGWLLSQIRRSRLYARGLLHFGPGPTYRGGQAVHLALDAFEEHYGRLPTHQEQVRLVRKLSWFEQQHRRVPTQEELAQIVEQLSLH